MCAPMNAAYADRIRAEIARGRRAAGLDPAPVAIKHFRTITAINVVPASAIRPVVIRTPIGEIMFYERVRQPVRDVPPVERYAAYRVLARVA